MSGRILIVDDVPCNRIVLQAQLSAACYDTALAVDGAEALRLSRSGSGWRPDLILVNLGLPDMPGPAVIRALRGDLRSRDIPIIGLTASADEAVRLAALAAGADDVIAKPSANQVLMARVRNLLRARTETPVEESSGFAEPPAIFEPCGKIALVASSRAEGEGLRTMLRQHLRDTLLVLDPAQALDQAVGGGADVYVMLLAADEVPTNALRLLSELKSRLSTRHAAVCLVGLSTALDAAAMAYDLGADDVVAPAVTTAELGLRLRGLLRRKRVRDRQRTRVADGLRLAMIDPLTGLFNRRYAVPELRAIAHRSAHTGHSYAVLVVDLDRFKAVNDRHGHAAGDTVLVEVAQRLRLSLREGDLLARIGGEEFLIALPDASLAEARLVAERLCHEIGESPVRLGSGAGLSVTASIGIAVASPGQRITVEAVVEAADLALRQAKGAGRNRVKSAA